MSSHCFCFHNIPFSGTGVRRDAGKYLLLQNLCTAHKLGFFFPFLLGVVLRFRSGLVPQVLRTITLYFQQDQNFLICLTILYLQGMIFLKLFKHCFLIFPQHNCCCRKLLVKVWKMALWICEFSLIAKQGQACHFCYIHRSMLEGI